MWGCWIWYWPGPKLDLNWTSWLFRCSDTAMKGTWLAAGGSKLYIPGPGTSYWLFESPFRNLMLIYYHYFQFYINNSRFFTHFYIFLYFFIFFIFFYIFKSFKSFFVYFIIDNLNFTCWPSTAFDLYSYWPGPGTSKLLFYEKSRAQFPIEYYFVVREI